MGKEKSLTYKIARLKHWQLFLLMFVPLFVAIGLALNFEDDSPSRNFLLLGRLIYFAFYLIWLWTIISCFNKSVPGIVNKRNAAIAMVVAFCGFILGAAYKLSATPVYFQQPSALETIVMFLLQLPAGISLLYLIYQTAKCIHRIEKGMIFIFLSICMWPIAIWTVQPILNREIENNEA